MRTFTVSAGNPSGHFIDHGSLDWVIKCCFYACSLQYAFHAFRGKSRYQALWLAENRNRLQSRSYGWLQSASRAYHLGFDLTSGITFAAACDWLGHVCNSYGNRLPSSLIGTWLADRNMVDPETRTDLWFTVQVSRFRPCLLYS